MKRFLKALANPAVRVYALFGSFVASLRFRRPSLTPLLQVEAMASCVFFDRYSRGVSARVVIGLLGFWVDIDVSVLTREKVATFEVDFGTPVTAAKVHLSVHDLTGIRAFLENRRWQREIEAAATAEQEKRDARNARRRANRQVAKAAAKTKRSPRRR